MLYSNIERAISALNKPLIIGVNGAIASGKTMFSEGLEQYLQDRGYPTQVIHIDDFHNLRSIRMKDNSLQTYIDNAIDFRKFEELIAEIKCRPVNKTMTLLDMGADAYISSKTFMTDMNTVVIVEGVLLYSPQIKHLFGYKIYLDVDDDEILRRGRERDVPLFGEQILRQYIDFYIPWQKMYEERSFPKEQSHLVIDYNDFQRPIIVKHTK
jgi:uridine kinase